MPVLSVRQEKDLRARVEFEGGEWMVDFRNPFTPEQEEELRWYFENHLEFPMLDTVRAERAAKSVREYGADLFEQLFQDAELRAVFRNQKADQVRVEFSGAPEFHRLHWETLWDAKQPAPLAYRSVVTRRMNKPGEAKIKLEAGAAIRVLVVVARPDRDEDVGYRTISRPLVETLRQAKLDVDLEFVRPGTWERLNEHLAGKPQGYYHALHFDGHGSVASKNQLREKNKFLCTAINLLTRRPINPARRSCFLKFPMRRVRRRIPRGPSPRTNWRA